MNDTPRTDKFTHSISKLANHARQLERELQAMAALDRLVGAMP